MITKAQAMTHKGEFWHMYVKNADGTPVRCRPNGRCKTWATRPEDWQLSVKYGLQQYFYLSRFNAHEWCLPELWEVEHVIFQGVKS